MVVHLQGAHLLKLFIMKANEVKTLGGSPYACFSESLAEDFNNLDADYGFNVGYTNHGGSFLDKVIIAYFEENYPENIIFENTSWDGKNAIIFGGIAKEFIECYESYALGFEYLENYYYQIEEDARNEYIQYLCELYPLTDLQIHEATEYLEENCTYLTSGVDICEIDLLNYVGYDIH